MQKVKYKILLLFIFLISLSCSSDDDHFSKDASFSGLIWKSDRYCAFTDLVKYNNIYYCCFRESDGHLPSSIENYGKIRILSSLDGVNWQSAILIEDEDYDLRDPKLDVTSDGRLMLLVGCSELDSQGRLNFKKTKVSFSYSDLLQLSNLQDLKLGKDSQFNHLWLWRSIWYKGKAYGVAYLSNNKPVLLNSLDGINYEEIVQFDLPISANESGITFRPNGNMVILIRDNNSAGYIGEAKFPYKEWNWKSLSIGSHCPELISVDNYIFLGIRNMSVGGVSLQYIKPNNGLNVNNLYNIPASGDIGYPGLLNDGTSILMTYYLHGSIFLIKYPLKTIFNRI